MKRTCLVTKTKAAPKDLLRFTVVDGQLKFDGDFKAPGRGGYVLKDEAVLEKLPRMLGKVQHFLKVKTVAVSAAEIKRGKKLMVSS